MWRLEFSLSEQGPRARHEDAHRYWLSSDKEAFVGVVCDGVGGNPCGDIASQVAAEAWTKFMSAEIQSGNTLSQSLLMQACESAWKALINKSLEKKLCAAMATTIVACAAQGPLVLALHCGDSRLYHIRKGQVLFVTRDHTLLNDLVLQGAVSEEEAKASGRSNVLSRVLSANLGRPPRPEFHLLHPACPGDFLLLCSDGVWAYVPEEDLMELLCHDSPAPAKLQQLKEVCGALTGDNFTAQLWTYLPD
ncbi:MAG: protein phosphatase 2C domain-containing protein [Flavobacteriales bacterium]|nr:protein phosphatase 2C domain-containing protein [Flavobacteriales bacterium]MDW8410601.1 protein phosphatase 2C domain-containing protein [Flavobacteriales bacterium]